MLLGAGPIGPGCGYQTRQNTQRVSILRKFDNRHVVVFAGINCQATCSTSLLSLFSRRGLRPSVTEGQSGQHHPARVQVHATAASVEGTAQSETVVPFPIVDPSKKNEDGTLSVKWVYVTASEMEQGMRELEEHEAARREQLSAVPIAQQDLHRLDVTSSLKPVQQDEVPGIRRITDPAELNLTGQGLPVIKGVSALRRLCAQSCTLHGCL